MKLSVEDKQLLDELCRQNEVSRDKVLKLLQTVYEYEFKDRHDALQEILKSRPSPEQILGPSPALDS